MSKTQDRETFEIDVALFRTRGDTHTRSRRSLAGGARSSSSIRRVGGLGVIEAWWGSRRPTCGEESASPLATCCLTVGWGQEANAPPQPSWHVSVGIDTLPNLANSSSPWKETQIQDRNSLGPRLLPPSPPRHSPRVLPLNNHSVIKNTLLQALLKALHPRPHNTTALPNLSS